MTVSPPPDLIAGFVAIVGVANAVTDPGAIRPYLAERRSSFPGATSLVLRPQTVAEVSAIMALAQETGTGIVPQGGNTGLVGAQVPDGSNSQVILALDRLNRVRSVDPDGDTITVEAGVCLACVKRAAEKAGRLFPLSLASEETAQIGGNISSNAGGTAVLAYGNTRDLVLGLEVVLPGGEVIDGLRALRKDNSGYDLKHLFIGAEGTLGVITAATLKLFPIPRGVATAFVAVERPADALALFHIARGIAGLDLTSFEFMPRIALDFCLRHLDGATDPLREPHPWYVLLEVSSGRSVASARADIDAILGEGHAAGLVREERVADSTGEARALWRLRYSISDVQRPEGVSLKHDVAVPIKDVPAFLEEATRAVLDLVPDCRPVPFGHLGDGNVHFNISQPVGDAALFMAAAKTITAAVHEVVARFRGSIAAEHGIGQMKRALLPFVRSDVELATMRKLKAVLDPKGIMNPGKIL
ncbi:MAG: FAD-binding oxidoreductase [Bauldia sp.]|nr:FAD-binding oxidoreductase [Bauldia sp.]